MSHHHLLILKASRRLLPRSFDWIVILLTIQAHLLVIVPILQSTTVYRSPIACWALWTISLGVPLGCVIAARRAQGSLSPPTFLGSSITLMLVDIGILLVTPSDHWAEPANWTWGTIGVSILTFGVFRPARDVLLLAGAHSLVGLSSIIVTSDSANSDAFHMDMVLVGTALPALIAADYLGRYASAVRLRRRAVQARLAIESQVETERLVREDSERRLRALRRQVIPLLNDVATGMRAIDDLALAQQARRLAEDLRRELVQARSGTWLFDVDLAEEFGPDGTQTSRWPGVTLLDPQDLLGCVSDSDRAAMVVVFGTLRHHGLWDHVSLALAPAPERAMTALVALVAVGPSADDASTDLHLRAMVERLRGTLTSESANTLLIEADLALSSQDGSKDG